MKKRDYKQKTKEESAKMQTAIPILLELDQASQELFENLLAALAAKQPELELDLD